MVDHEDISGPIFDHRFPRDIILLDECEGDTPVEHLGACTHPLWMFFFPLIAIQLVEEEFARHTEDRIIIGPFRNFRSHLEHLVDDAILDLARVHVEYRHLARVLVGGIHEKA